MRSIIIVKITNVKITNVKIMNVKITKRIIVSALTLNLMQASFAVISDEVTTTSNESASVADEQRVIADFRIANSQVSAIETGSTDTEDAAPTGDDAPSSPEASKIDAKAIVDAALGKDAFERYRLAASANGFFTNTEQQQSLHVIVNRTVTAVAKEVIPSILVIFQNEKPITQFVPSKASYLDIASVFDINEDGLDEVLLTASAFQMGSQFVAADVYSFKVPSDILKQEMGVVYVNACDTAIEENKHVSASVLSTTHNSNVLVAESYVAPCNKNGELPNVELFSIQ